MEHRGTAQSSAIESRERNSGGQPGHNRQRHLEGPGTAMRAAALDTRLEPDSGHSGDPFWYDHSARHLRRFPIGAAYSVPSTALSWTPATRAGICATVGWLQLSPLDRLASNWLAMPSPHFVCLLSSSPSSRSPPPRLQGPCGGSAKSGSQLCGRRSRGRRGACLGRDCAFRRLLSAPVVARARYRARPAARRGIKLTTDHSQEQSRAASGSTPSSAPSVGIGRWSSSVGGLD